MSRDSNSVHLLTHRGLYLNTAMVTEFDVVVSKTIGSLELSRDSNVNGSKSLKVRDEYGKDMKGDKC